jgi:transposase
MLQGRWWCRRTSAGTALPGYSPELNPQEHLWDELGEKEFPNRVFSDMAA